MVRDAEDVPVLRRTGIGGEPLQVDRPDPEAGEVAVERRERAEAVEQRGGDGDRHRGTETRRMDRKQVLLEPPFPGEPGVHAVERAPQAADLGRVPGDPEMGRVDPAQERGPSRQVAMDPGQVGLEAKRDAVGGRPGEPVGKAVQGGQAHQGRLPAVELCDDAGTGRNLQGLELREETVERRQTARTLRDETMQAGEIAGLGDNDVDEMVEGTLKVDGRRWHGRPGMEGDDDGGTHAAASKGSGSARSAR